MEYLLRTKGIYKISLGIEIYPIDDEAKVSKLDKKKYKHHGLIGMSISLDLIFHLYGLDSPIEAWEKFHNLFGLKTKFELINLKMSYLPQTLVIFLQLKIMYTILIPLYFS